MANEPTPLMKQYAELKEQAGDALLFFRMGDFYELFGDDAVEAARILEITLTSRDKNKPDPLPMAGVPHHSAGNYVQKLLNAGKKVAICEQFEEAAAGKPGKTLVRRAIVRLLTPAIQFDGESSETSYLATALPETPGDPQSAWALGCLDIATGDFRFAQLSHLDELSAWASDLPIRHWVELQGLAPSGLAATLQAAGQGLGRPVLCENLPSNYLGQAASEDKLKAQFGLASLDAFVPEGVTRRALGVLLTYALRSQSSALGAAETSNPALSVPSAPKLQHLRLPEPLRRSRSMVLGPRTAQHLDLFPDLFQLISRTRSALGTRTLKRLLMEPLRDPQDITHRQEGIQELALKAARAESLGKLLGQLYDLERISGRLTTGQANPRDTWALGASLGTLPELGRILDSAESPLLQELRERLLRGAEVLGSLSRRILDTQNEEAPLLAREGGIFKKGTNSELDRLIDLSTEGSKFLVELETRERERTGIPSLKVRYNRVFGYYIEVTQAHLKNVPADYQRKQTTVGAERFFTEELKKFEDEIVTAEDRRKRLEQSLFSDLLEEAQRHTLQVMDVARALGELDSWLSLSRLTEMPGWVFPRIDDSLDVEILGGRHPVVDSVSRGKFVPNDLKLGQKSRLSLLITGPNMGGKSTVMRQVALIVLLGQCGAPVPARSARWGAFSSIYTRIGAHDAIARGQSTFMVEMSELAHILHRADERSLVILDEIGRGTSTYDGISVAWSTLEWICKKLRCRTLFATHYHELTHLSEELPRLGNAHMAVAAPAQTNETQLRFLYQLREGAANESFGIQVAQLAGLPRGVIDRAWKVLARLESDQRTPGAAIAEPLVLGSGPGEQLDEVLPLFASASSQRGLTRRADDAESVGSIASTAPTLPSIRSALSRLFDSDPSLAGSADLSGDLFSSQDHKASAGAGAAHSPEARAATETESRAPAASRGLPVEPPLWASELARAEISNMTPLQAMNFLAQLQEKARSS